MNLTFQHMKLSAILSLVFMALFFMACESKKEEPQYDPLFTEEDKKKAEEPKAKGSPKGVGEVKDVKLTDPLDQAMIKEGQMIYDMKCASCHKLSDERVVGPGWSGITNKRTPEWIMNMITNVDIMLAEDPQAQALLEECLVRMPNQNVSITDARSVLEFMRKNDMETVGSKDKASGK